MVYSTAFRKSKAHLAGFLSVVQTVMTNRTFLNILSLSFFLQLLVMSQLLDNLISTVTEHLLFQVMSAISIVTHLAITPFPPWLTDVAIALGMIPGIVFILIVFAIIRAPTTMVVDQKVQRWAPSENLWLRLENTAKYIRRALAISSAWVTAGLKAWLASIHRRRPIKTGMGRWTRAVLCFPMVMGPANAAPVISTPGAKFSPEVQSLIVSGVVAGALVLMLAMFGVPQGVTAKLMAIWQWGRDAVGCRRLRLELLDGETNDLVEMVDRETVGATAGDTMAPVTEQSSAEVRLQWQVLRSCTAVNQTEGQLDGHLDHSSLQSRTETVVEAGSWVGVLPAVRLMELEDDDLVEYAESSGEPVSGQ